VMNTAAYNKFCMEVELLRSKLTLSVSLLDTVNLNLYEEEVDKMQVDQTASADTLMVLLTLLSQAEVFSPGEIILTVLLRLKSYPQEQPTLPMKGGSPERLWTKFLIAMTIQWCSSIALETRIMGSATRLFCSDKKTLIVKRNL